jgi:hypothetical protein
MDRTLLDANGVPVDITGATVKLTLTPIHGGAPIVNDEAMQIVNAAAGQVRYPAAPTTPGWTAAKTAVPGDYLGAVRVTFAGGAVETFPNGGYILVTITPTPATTAGAYVTREELKLSLKLEGTTYVDEDIDDAIAAAAKAIDNYCNRTFAAAAADTTRKYDPVSSEWVSVHDLQQAPTSVTVSGTALVLDTDYYLAPVPVATPGPPYGALRKITVSFPRNVPQSVVVVGRFGWPSVPDPIVSATKIVGSRILQRSRSAPFGILPFGDQGEAMRITQADPDVRFLLAGYRRSDLMAQL